MKRRFERKPVMKLMLSLMMIFLSAIPGWTQQLIGEKSDFILEYKDSYSRLEVETLVNQILQIANQEMERCATEAAREAVIQEAQDTAYLKAVKEQLTMEIHQLHVQNMKLEKQNRNRTISLWVTGSLSILLGTLLIVDVVR